MCFKKGEKVYVNSYQNFTSYGEPHKYLPKNTLATVRQDQIGKSVLIQIGGYINLEVYEYQVSYEPKKSIKFYKGDEVKVYSLGAWKSGGFLEGKEATVNRYNPNGSVSISVVRNFGGDYKMDQNFHVWPEQLKLVGRNVSVWKLRKSVSKFLIGVAKRLDPNKIKLD